MAHRPQGRPRSGDLHGGHRGAAHPQVTRGPPGRYRAHVVAEPETGIITDEALTRAAGTENSDPGVAEKFLAADDEVATVEATTPTEDGEDEDGVDGPVWMGPVWMGPAHGSGTGIPLTEQEICVARSTTPGTRP
ncbi:hypothetical protein FXW78_29335 [Rhodococcus opacus]|nr:hypothetical protein [Rhodococcus opacus]